MGPLEYAPRPGTEPEPTVPQNSRPWLQDRRPTQRTLVETVWTLHQAVALVQWWRIQSGPSDAKALCAVAARALEASKQTIEVDGRRAHLYRLVEPARWPRQRVRGSAEPRDGAHAAPQRSDCPAGLTRTALLAQLNQCLREPTREMWARERNRL